MGQKENPWKPQVFGLFVLLPLGLFSYPFLTHSHIGCLFFVFNAMIILPRLVLKV